MWKVPPSTVASAGGVTNVSTSISPGVELSWEAPVVATGNGTIGIYDVYVVMNSISGTSPVFFKRIRRTAIKSALSAQPYTIAPPATSIFFPFNWTPPSGYSFPITKTTTINNVTTVIPCSLSFQIVASLVEDNDISSDPVGITVFEPNQDSQGIPTHMNPRFSLTSSYDVATFNQDTYEEVASCVEMVLSTSKYTRTALPDFGIDDPTFTSVNVNELQETLKNWEPRATVAISLQFYENGETGYVAGGEAAGVNIQIVDINNNP
jgi:hypothetical protein